MEYKFHIERRHHPGGQAWYKAFALCANHGHPLHNAQISKYQRLVSAVDNEADIWCRGGKLSCRLELSSSEWLEHL